MKEKEIQSAVASIADGLARLSEILKDMPKKDDEEPRGPYVGLAEAAKYLHCTAPTVRRYAESGLINCVKFGARSRYSVPSMDKFIAIYK